MEITYLKFIIIETLSQYIQDIGKIIGKYEVTKGFFIFTQRIFWFFWIHLLLFLFRNRRPLNSLQGSYHSRKSLKEVFAIVLRHNHFFSVKVTITNFFEIRSHNWKLSIFEIIAIFYLAISNYIRIRAFEWLTIGKHYKKEKLWVFITDWIGYNRILRFILLSKFIVNFNKLSWITDNPLFDVKRKRGTEYNQPNTLVCLLLEDVIIEINAH